jgi:hypothetical protein
MANKLQIKRTSVSGRAPNTTNAANTTYIDAGELALNLADGKLFSSNGAGLIEFGTGTPVYDSTGTLLTNTYMTYVAMGALQTNVTPATDNIISVGQILYRFADGYFAGTLSVGNTSVNTQITSSKVTTPYLTLTGAGNAALIDTTNSNASYANGAAVHFPNFSGMIIVNNTGTTGQVALHLCGGGSVGVLGYSGTGVPHKTGTITSNVTNNGYTWVNDSGATDTFSFAVIKTRAGA